MKLQVEYVGGPWDGEARERASPLPHAIRLNRVDDPAIDPTLPAGEILRPGPVAGHYVVYGRDDDGAMLYRWFPADE